MKSVLIIAGTFLIVVCAALGAVLFGQFQSNRSLREANEEMRNALRAAQSAAEALSAGHQEVLAQMAQAQSRSEELAARIAQFEMAGTTAATGSAPDLAPYQANAFLGRDWLGTAWIIPRNVRLDTNTQRYVYEPVVWLDERLRDSFVKHHTNVVEREIETQTTYNTTYYPTPVYYFTHPSRYRPPSEPSQPSWPHNPQGAYPAPPAFNPGNGAVIPQKLGTPADQIKTRPQVVGKPPANPQSR